MKHLDNKSRVAALLSMCWALGNTACDRSWRDENFAAPGVGTVGEGNAPPPIRPTAPGTINPTTTTLPLQPGAPTTPGPSDLEADASVGTNEPSGDDTGADHTGDVDTGDDTPNVTGEPVQGETESPDTDEQGSNPPPADTQSGEVTTDGDIVDPPDEPEPFTKLGLLEAASACAVEQYQAFAQSARTLRTAVRAIEDDATLIAAQQAFNAAMLTFQRVEVFRVGPAARAMDPGGRDLRDWIYSFPTQNRCQVDRNLVSEAYASNFDGVLFNARGLLALEYLLFGRTTTNACTAGIDINVKGTWAALSQSQLNARRDAYARALADDIAERADQLVEAWAEDGDNFIAQVVKAGNGSTTFPTQQAALNAFSHALFYVEREVKDYKLGWPLGIVAECTKPNGCPEMAELPYSWLSGPSISQNLAAFRLLFEGCGENYQGLGFDDWLREADQGELADRMLTSLTATEQQLATLDVFLEDAFYDAPAKARAVHTALKGVTDLLKTEFVSVLNLELPMTAEGDND